MSIIFYEGSDKIYDKILNSASSSQKKAIKKAKEFLEDFSKCRDSIASYNGGTSNPHFYLVRSDIEKISKFLPSYSTKKNIVVIGNGGSIRNTIALYDALFNQISSRSLFFIDSIESSGVFGDLLSQSSDFSPTNTLIVSISKSGNTINVLKASEVLFEKGYELLVVTSSSNSSLFDFAKKNSLPFLPHDDVGGRFSAGHNNSFLPIALLLGKIDKIVELDQSFCRAHKEFLPEVDLDLNLAKALSLRLYIFEILGFTELFVFGYGRCFRGLGELIIQLVHESYCKKGMGQTVIYSDAPESHHHTNQRFFDGRKNMLGLSIRLENSAKDVYLSDGLKCNEFIDLEHSVLLEEAEKNDCPHMVLSLDNLSASDVASVISLWQWTAVYSGILRGVNPFDQPAVENSKKIMEMHVNSNKKSVEKFKNVVSNQNWSKLNFFDSL